MESVLGLPCLKDNHHLPVAVVRCAVKGPAWRRNLPGGSTSPSFVVQLRWVSVYLASMAWYGTPIYHYLGLGTCIRWTFRERKTFYAATGTPCDFPVFPVVLFEPSIWTAHKSPTVSTDWNHFHCLLQRRVQRFYFWWPSATATCHILVPEWTHDKTCAYAWCYNLFGKLLAALVRICPNVWIWRLPRPISGKPKIWRWITTSTNPKAKQCDQFILLGFHLNTLLWTSWKAQLLPRR